MRLGEVNFSVSFLRMEGKTPIVLSIFLKNTIQISIFLSESTPQNQVESSKKHGHPPVRPDLSIFFEASPSNPQDSEWPVSQNKTFPSLSRHILQVQFCV